MRCESVNIFPILAQEIQREIAEDEKKEAKLAAHKEERQQALPPSNT